MTSWGRVSRAWVPIAVGLALTASCSSAPQPDLTRPAASSDVDENGGSTAPRVAPAVDLRDAARSPSLAFHDEHGRLAASGATFEVRLAEGAIAVTPRRPARTQVASPLAVERGAELSLRTSLVTRGTRTLARDDGTHGDTASRTGLEADGAVSMRRGEILERIATDDAGVEQSWRFDRAPEGDGDLVVHVQASGPRYATSSGHGLHFERGPAGGSRLGLRYGVATWVDAAGRRTVVTPRFVGGEIVMTVPGEVLAASSYPAVLDPTISAEQEIDQPISGSSASGDQYSPAIVSAGAGKGYVAVWYDQRGVRPSLYAARINSDGTVKDDTGIPIATGVASTTPTISASDTGFLVTWAVSYVDIYQQPGIYAVRLDAQANPLDAAPVAVVQNQTNLGQPTSAFDGTEWLVAWSRYSGGATSYDISGARVPRSGAPLDAMPFDISVGPESEYDPIVTFDGASFLVAWRTYTNILGRRYGKDGKPLAPRQTLATATYSSLAAMRLTTQGTQHVLVWEDYSPTTSYDIFAKRINLDGTPIDLGNIVVNQDPSYDETPRVIWDGTSYVVAWARNDQLVTARLSTAGAVLDPVATVIASGGNYYDDAVASDGMGTLALSRAIGTGLAGSDIDGVKIGKPPAPGATPFVVSKAANSETEPSTSWNGTQHFTVWLDTREGKPAIYGAALSAGGQPQAATKIVSDARFTSALTRPRIASDGSGYLVVFYAYDASPTVLVNRQAIRGLRLDATGKPDPSGVFDVYLPTNLNDQVSEPDVAFDGSSYLVVWQNQSFDGGNQSSIAGVRLTTASNTPLDKEPLRISAATPVESRSVPSVAFDGQNFFVAWITSRQAPGSGIQVSHVYGTRVSKEGASLDGELSVCNAFLLQRAPHVAGDTRNGGFMVVWEDYRTALEAADVYGARISAQGQNLDGTSGSKIAAGTYDESRPQVTASGDGTNFIVAWRDLRSKQTYDIYGAWISVAGKNHDPSGIALSAEAGDEDAPWLSASGDGNFVVSYQRLDPRTGYGSYRIRARSVTGGTKVTGACKKDDDCASRSCVDGVCCQTECGACGTCSATPGTCTPRAAGSEAASCPEYKCKGTLECPNKCATDADCASNATCDPSSKTCVSRVICLDDATLKDLTGKLAACAPYRCVADACRTQCGSVDDCAPGFVCDYGGRCIQPPTGSDGGCATSGGAPSGAGLAAAVWFFAAAVARRRKRGAHAG